MALSRRSLITVGVSGAAGVAAGLVVPFDASADKPSGADVGFCTDMTVHHVQALAMCQRVLGRPTGDPVQAAAAEVLQNQSIEVGMMRAWLTDWGVSTATPSTVMAWMHHDEGRRLDAMPGYASDDELRSLSTSTGSAQGHFWLRLMRAHHVGGVAMAEAAIDLVSDEKVRRLAATQVATQSYEIAQYDRLLATEYASA